MFKCHSEMCLVVGAPVSTGNWTAAGSRREAGLGESVRCVGIGSSVRPFVGVGKTRPSSVEAESQGSTEREGSEAGVGRGLSETPDRGGQRQVGRVWTFEVLS